MKSCVNSLGGEIMELKEVYLVSRDLPDSFTLAMMALGEKVANMH